MSQSSGINIDIALSRLHEMATEEGDLGREYWCQISELLKRASNMQNQIDRLSKELELCRARLERGDGAA